MCTGSLLRHPRRRRRCHRRPSCRRRCHRRPSPRCRLVRHRRHRLLAPHPRRHRRQQQKNTAATRSAPGRSSLSKTRSLSNGTPARGRQQQRTSYTSASAAIAPPAPSATKSFPLPTSLATFTCWWPDRPRRRPALRHPRRGRRRRRRRYRRTHLRLRLCRHHPHRHCRRRRNRRCRRRHPHLHRPPLRRCHRLRRPIPLRLHAPSRLGLGGLSSRATPPART